MVSRATCHALPCNIDYTGKAPVDVYFRPTPTEDGKFQAAAFRGRGLLATNAASPNVVLGSNTTANDTMESSGDHVEICQRTVVQGHLFDTVTGGTNNGRHLRSIAQFDQLTQWHHEHQTQALMQKETSCRLDIALDWIEVATALHAPLPLPDKK